LSFYLDASALVAMFTDDPFSARVDLFLENNQSKLIVSDFAGAELASTVARHFRNKQIAVAMARNIFAKFDTWAAEATERAETTTEDVALAETMLRRLDLNLRAPDAIHIALSQRLGATLVTFDEKMAASARTLQLAVAKT
jgi:hypothetical protein